MVVFTGVDKLPKGVFIEEHIANTGESLQWLVERCGSRYTSSSLIKNSALNKTKHVVKVNPVKVSQDDIKTQQMLHQSETFSIAGPAPLSSWIFPLEQELKLDPRSCC